MPKLRFPQLNVMKLPSKIHIKDKSQAGQLIVVAPFRKDVRKTEPHKHNNYFEILYLSKGNGTHTIDHNSYAIQPPVIFFVRKEQVHHWELLTEPEGYVVIVKRSFVDKSLDNELKTLLTKISSLSSLQVKDNATIDSLFQLLTKEHNVSSENSFAVMEGLLKALLAKVLEVAQPLLIKTKRTVDLFQSFRELLAQSADIQNNVAYYAGKLNTTPQNLNAICRKMVNKPAATVLAEYLIGEAKRLLVYTDNTVAEISIILRFNDPSHFVKYFKRFTGCTPRIFRNS